MAGSFEGGFMVANANVSYSMLDDGVYKMFGDWPNELEPTDSDPPNLLHVSSLSLSPYTHPSPPSRPLPMHPRTAQYPRLLACRPPPPPPPTSGESGTDCGNQLQSRSRGWRPLPSTPVFE